ncbi:YraN family protein [Sphingomonas sp.]|uniref:YraN family protein n=1 Tax=Sphingomonas sp. TaxID=28214 RepID=UPI00325FAE7D
MTAPRPVRDRAAAERAGRRAETIAAWWLRFHGWSILAMRARVRVGEIDIVARRGRMIAFVEVKARSTDFAADLALDPYRLRRVFAAAETLFHRYRRPGDDMRVDAIFIVPGKWPRHLVNLWRD